jgi:hypothetical protein
VQNDACKESEHAVICSDLTGIVPCEILIEYFLHVAQIAGLHDDFNVFSEAWTITVRVLMSARALNMTENVTGEHQGTPASIPRKFKAVVVAACALAVDVCGDFEAVYAHSAFAWAKYFVRQIQGTDAIGSSESDCYQLMRMKMIAGRALRWNIGFDTPVNSFYFHVEKLREYSACERCKQLFGPHTGQYELVLQSLSFLLLPKGQPCDVIAQTTLAFLHNRAERGAIPTPMGRCLVGTLPACLALLFPNMRTTGYVTDCLMIAQQNSEYVDYLLKAITSMRTSTAVKSLAAIEREYINESTTDSQSSA